MKTAAQLIAEMEQKYAEIARVEAEQYAASAKILAWMFAELNTAAVKERFPDVRFHLVADEGPPFVIYWGDKLLGRVGDSQDGGVRAVIGSDKSIERFTTRTEEFTDAEGALGGLLELLRDYWEDSERYREVLERLQRQRDQAA
jgi:hypothetical protein